MMEGLLQGRVVYTYEEFKKRKFDKLFHYIIDLLNVLVPYVFHQEYLSYIEPIISHYFDVFRVIFLLKIKEIFKLMFNFSLIIVLLYRE